jgi:hypothetical protein
LMTGCESLVQVYRITKHKAFELGRRNNPLSGGGKICERWARYL